MKWPTKKPSSLSSSSTSHGFPTSWITKFKLKREIPTKTKEKQQGSRFVYREDARDCRGIMDETAAADEKHKGQKPKKPMLVRNEIDQMRKSVYIGRGSSKDQDRPSKQQQQRKSTCKIKAIENLKKANKKKPSKSVTEGGMESFAVVKHSQDPQRDFRDSMMDMIMEKGIKDPDQMEKLLACYLRLNDDEYHDLIIKAFRQVWCEFDHIRALNHQLLELNLVSDN